MIRNYLKVALRNILRHKAFSFINIVGLAVGMACCLLILLFVRDELSFDRYHSNADRIFRLEDSFGERRDQADRLALSSAPFAPTLKNEFPQVEEAVRLMPGGRRMVTIGEKKLYEDNIFFADNSLFSVFSFPLLKGDPGTALSAPNALVVSGKIAQKYFGTDDPLDKILKINDQEFRVTGIMAEMPRRSHFYADMFASMATLERMPNMEERFFTNWARHEFYTYLLLREAGDAGRLEARLPTFIEKHAAQQLRAILGETLSSSLKPLTRIHLYSQAQYELGANGDIRYVILFSVIAIFILLIACVNYMNLATARSAARAKEVGLRKTVGASRAQLVGQFFGESFLFTAIAMVLSVLLALGALPFFNSLAGKAIGPGDLRDGLIVGFMAAVLLLVGLGSGSYPAISISGFRPTGALKRSDRDGSGRALLRKALVIGQFAVSIALIIATAVVLDQLDFLRNRKLGFVKDHVVVIPVREKSIRTDIETIKADLKRNPGVLSASLAIGVPGGTVAGDAIDLMTGEGRKKVTLRMIYADYDYIKTMGMEIAEGRDFSRDMGTDDREAIIINEAAVRGLGLRTPLETRFEWNEKKGRVIGVVKDFQFQSLRDEITPLVIQIFPNGARVVAVRIRPDHIPETLAFLESRWKVFDPSHPFEYAFMDKTFDSIYRGEERLAGIFRTFALLAIFIACLGLFGLALYTVEQRTREIGIRKVLGASLGKIAVLLSKEFMLLVLMANVLAWPAAFYVMRRWLQNFAYRVEIRPGIFLASAGAAFVIALITISYHTLRAALADPVKSIRHE
jgi:putative ABC transport system permease protein